GHEVEVVVALLPRVPRAVFGALQAGYSGLNRCLLQLQRVQSRDVALVAEAEKIALAPDRMAIYRHGDTEERAVGQSGLLDDVAAAVLLPDVDIDLAGTVGDDRRSVDRRVVGAHHDRLFLGMRTRDGILERHLPQPGQLPSFAGMRAGSDARPGTAVVGDLLAIHEDALASTKAVGKKGALRRQVGRA